MTLNSSDIELALPLYPNLRDLEDPDSEGWTKKELYAWRQDGDLIRNELTGRVSANEIPPYAILILS